MKSFSTSQMTNQMAHCIAPPGSWVLLPKAGKRWSAPEQPFEVGRGTVTLSHLLKGRGALEKGCVLGGRLAGTCWSGEGTGEHCPGLLATCPSDGRMGEESQRRACSELHGAWGCAELT